MENLEPYLDRFSESSKRVFESAFEESRRRGQHFISPEHVLFALIKEEIELFNKTIRNLSIDPQDFQPAIEKRLENSRRHLGKGFRIAHETIEIFKYSMDRARSEGRRTIDATNLCFVLTTTKLDLLKDILQNPEGNHRVIETSKIGTKEVQPNFPLHQFQHRKPSDFFARFSLQELVREDTSTSGLLFAAGSSGGVGTSGSGGNSEQTTRQKHETLFSYFKFRDFGRFDQAQFILSLQKDVERRINQSGLMITETNNPDSTSFHFEYQDEDTKGQIDIFGQKKNDYYELKVVIAEKSVK